MTETLGMTDAEGLPSQEGSGLKHQEDDTMRAAL